MWPYIAGTLVLLCPHIAACALLGSLPQSEPSPAAAAAAQQSSLSACLSQASQPTQAATSTAAVGALPLQEMASLTGRLEAACQQVIQDLPGQTQPESPSTATPHSTSTRRVQLHSRLQLHTYRSTTTKAPNTARVHVCSNHGSTQQQQQQQAGRVQPTLQSLQPPTVLVDTVQCQHGADSMPVSCKSRVCHAAPYSISNPYSQELDTPAQQQQQLQSPTEQPLQLHPPHYAVVPFRLQHLRVEVLSDSTSPRSGRSQGGKPSCDSNSVHHSDRAGPAALAGGCCHKNGFDNHNQQVANGLAVMLAILCSNVLAPTRNCCLPGNRLHTSMSTTATASCLVLPTRAWDVPAPAFTCCASCCFSVCLAISPQGPVAPSCC